MQYCLRAGDSLGFAPSMHQHRRPARTSASFPWAQLRHGSSGVPGGGEPALGTAWYKPQPTVSAGAAPALWAWICWGWALETQPESSWGAGRGVDAASPPSLRFVRVSLEQQQELRRRRRRWCHPRGQAGLQHASLEHSNIPKGQTCYPPRYRLDNTVENPNTPLFWESEKQLAKAPHPGAGGALLQLPNGARPAQPGPLQPLATFTPSPLAAGRLSARQDPAQLLGQHHRHKPQQHLQLHDLPSRQARFLQCTNSALINSSIPN